MTKNSNQGGGGPALKTDVCFFVYENLSSKKLCPMKTVAQLCVEPFNGPLYQTFLRTSSTVGVMGKLLNDLNSTGIKISFEMYNRKFYSNPGVYPYFHN